MYSHDVFSSHPTHKTCFNAARAEETTPKSAAFVSASDGDDYDEATRILLGVKKTLDEIQKLSSEEKLEMAANVHNWRGTLAENKKLLTENLDYEELKHHFDMWNAYQFLRRDDHAEISKLESNELSQRVKETKEAIEFLSQAGDHPADILKLKPKELSQQVKQVKEARKFLSQAGYDPADVLKLKPNELSQRVKQVKAQGKPKGVLSRFFS